MKNGGNGGDALGNTKPKRLNQAKKWCFTFNNYTDDLYNEIIDKFKMEAKKYIIGKEVGEQGTPHLQGYVELKNSIRPTELKLSKSIHWEVSKGNEEQNINYCSKENNYISFGLKKPLKILKETELYDWQKNIIEIIKIEPDDRSIYWIYEKEGNKGKTSLCKYLIKNYDACLLDGKKNDILYVAAENDKEIYIYDIPRSYEGFVSYDAIEKIKNGLYMSGKYESISICRNSPHVIIFANFEPDINKLSLDRWKIIHI